MKRRKIISCAACLTGLAIIIYAGIGMFNVLSEEHAACGEYAKLREIAFEVTSTDYDADALAVINEESLTRLYELNSAFVGWIEIQGTDVNYPVVKGRDNSFYLRRTFLGEPNRSGSIFMDFRSESDLSTPLTILYGHNMRNGSMFSTLTRFTSQTFLESNTEIRIFTSEADIVYYDIIKAWSTDVSDEVYSLNFDNVASVQGFFENYSSEHFLVLSTCMRGANRDDRFIVAAARRALAD